MSKKFKVAIIGDFQDGKSTLVNALMGQEVATVGWRVAQTSEVTAYDLPDSSVAMLDTPGANVADAKRRDDTAKMLKGCEMADAIVFMLRKQISPPQIKLLRQATNNGKKVFTIMVNDHDDDVAPQRVIESSAKELDASGLHPILFGEEGIVVNAKARSKGKACDDEQGWQRLRYLLGVGQPGKSPLERIAILYNKINEITR